MADSTTVTRPPQLNRAALKLALEQAPRSNKGDVLLTTVAELAQYFTEEDVLALCNKALYYLAYQAEHHKKRRELQREQRLAERETKIREPGPTDKVNSDAVARALRRKALTQHLREREEAEERALLEMALAEELADQQNGRADEASIEALNDALGGLTTEKSH